MTLRSWIRRSYKAPPGNRAGGTGSSLSKILGIVLILIVYLSIAVPGLATPLPGSTIDNTAKVQFQRFPGTPTKTKASNTQSDVVVPLPTPAEAAFMRYQPGVPGTTSFQLETTQYSTTGLPDGPFIDLPQPFTRPGNNPIDFNVATELLETDMYLSGDPLFLQLEDLDQNLFYYLQETVTVTVTSSTGDQEVLILHESELNSGIFLGYIQSSRLPGSSGDGILFVESNGTIRLSYVDNNDPTDLATANALFDPQGFVFDSETGELVDGVTITIIDASTGQPAMVFGDDGVSQFPSTVVSGGSVTDSGGTIYQFPTGGYRFPLMLRGDYQLIITPGQGHAAPSGVPEET